MTQKAKLVFITEESPYPPTSGGKLRDYCLIELLRELFEIELLVFDSIPGTSPPPGVILNLIERDKPCILRRALGRLRPYILNGYSQNMEKAIQQHSSDSKILWISRLVMAKYLIHANTLGYLTILDEHNIESELLFKGAQEYKGWLKRYYLQLALSCRKWEATFCSLATSVTVTSEEDRKRIQDLASISQVQVIPNAVDCTYYESAPPVSASPSSKSLNQSILFTGTLDYAPNIEGLRWFTQKVYPLLKEQLDGAVPSLTFLVAGARPSSLLIHELESSGIKVVANPPSMIPLLHSASIVIVPLLSGSGTRLKILEAMSAGKAIVSTSKGAEGLEIEDAKDLLIADTAEDFAEAIVQLWNHTEIRQKLGQNAVSTVRTRYDWRQLRPAIKRLIDEVLKKS